ncbi:hypothetical protein ACLESD_49940 [Pyxidicoccus sp. 3LFB2]
MSGTSPKLILQLLLLVAALGGFAYVSWRVHQRRRKVWSEFAARHDWSLKESWGDLEVRGPFLGGELRLRTETRRRGKNRETVTVLQLSLGDTVPQSLVLEPEGLGDKFLKLFGRKGEEVGDEALDAALDLKNVSPETRSILLAPRVREPLLALHRESSDFSIKSGRLTAEQRGMPETLGALELRVAPALALAEALDVVARHPEERVRG